MTTTSVRLAAALAAVALLAVGCGDDDGGGTAAEDETTATTASRGGDRAGEGSGDGSGAGEEGDGDGAGGAGAGTAAGAPVEVVDSDLGPILAADGRTLYVFLPDEGGPSTCYDECATTWPPLMADGEPTAGEGVEAELGTVPRDDGGEQVTVAGWPLYFYAPDTEPGDVLGQGVGDVWYVVAPDGTPVRD